MGLRLSQHHWKLLERPCKRGKSPGGGFGKVKTPEPSVSARAGMVRLPQVGPGKAKPPHPASSGTTQDSPHLSRERSICLVPDVLPGRQVHPGSCFPYLTVFIRKFRLDRFSRVCPVPGKLHLCCLRCPSPQSCRAGRVVLCPFQSPGIQGLGTLGEPIPHRCQLPRARAGI